MGGVFFQNNYVKSGIKIWHRRDKSGLKDQSCVILYIILSFNSCYTRFGKKSVKPSFFRNLLAAHICALVMLIPPETITVSTIMVDTFNDDASFYVVTSYG